MVRIWVCIYVYMSLAWLNNLLLLSFTFAYLCACCVVVLLCCGGVGPSCIKVTGFVQGCHEGENSSCIRPLDCANRAKRTSSPRCQTQVTTLRTDLCPSHLVCTVWVHVRRTLRATFHCSRSLRLLDCTDFQLQRTDIPVASRSVPPTGHTWGGIWRSIHGM